MASEPKATKDTAASARPRMRQRNKILLILFSLIMMGVLRTGFMLILIGLLPAIVTYYTDTTRKHYMFKSVFACNLAGMMPFIGQLLHNGPRSSIMQDIMGDGSNWMIIYGSAFIGWLMVKTAPMIALTLINGFHGTQIARLKSNQRRIENEWGKEVTQFSKRPEEPEDSFWGI